jgi:hypothetical protein
MRQQEFPPLDFAVMPRCAEPATFRRTPSVPSSAGLERALVGVPCALGSTTRAGARHGPAQRRELSRLSRRVNAASASAPCELCQGPPSATRPHTRSTSWTASRRFRRFAPRGLPRASCRSRPGATTRSPCRSCGPSPRRGRWATSTSRPTPTPSIPYSAPRSIMARRSGGPAKRSSWTPGA